MLHNRIYNEAFTQDLRDASIAGNSAFLESECLRLMAKFVDCKQVDDCSHFDPDFTRLFLSMSLLDAMKRHGQSIQLVCDLVNF